MPSRVHIFLFQNMQDGAGVLVFQSCSNDNFKECQDPSGLNLEQSKIVIKHMAEFHASSRAFVVKHGVTGVKRRYPMLAQVINFIGRLIVISVGKLTTILVDSIVILKFFVGTFHPA